MGEKLNFHIDHLDPLGQGVHKDAAGITFIPKTLPGEQGVALITKRARGVNFARAISLESAAPERLVPVCPHYSECPGCQYLHAPYGIELENKQRALERLLKPLALENGSEIFVHSAPKRWSYRNRLQLHYDLPLKKLGMLTDKGILPIPDCLMPNEDLLDAFVQLQQNWQGLIVDGQKQGHIEIYAKDGKVHTSVNRPYSHGGFTQVYKEMNDKALELIREHTQGLAINHAFDLFGGSGNLSAHLHEAKVHVVDGVRPEAQMAQHQSFISLNLFAKDGLNSLLKLSQRSDSDLLLVDPPRSGFVGLADYVNRFQPKNLVYMSCFTPTMVRDLKQLNIKNSQLEFHLLDFFPATQHFETLAFIRLK